MYPNVWTGRYGFRFPAWTSDFYVLQKRPDWLGGSPNLLFSGWRSYFPGIMRPGSEASHTTPSAEVNE
jgi:hypothetical protein